MTEINRTLFISFKEYFFNVLIFHFQFKCSNPLFSFENISLVDLDDNTQLINGNHFLVN